MERLGLEAQGGAVRVGAVHYNTTDEIDRFLEAVAALVSSGATRRAQPSNRVSSGATSPFSTS